MEIVVAIVIMGLFTVMLAPKFYKQYDVAGFSEAVQAARSYYAAEKRYAIDNNSCTNVCGDLDITAALKSLTVVCVAADCSVTVTRTGLYRVVATADGRLSCLDIATGQCAFLNKYLGN